MSHINQQDDTPPELKLLIEEAEKASNESKFNNAIVLWEKVIETCISIYGENNEKTAYYYNEFGLSLRTNGNHEKSKFYFLKAYLIQKQTLESHKPLMAEYCNNLGMACIENGEYEYALDYFKHALAIYQKMFGEKHIGTAECYNNIAKFYSIEGSHEIAIEYIEQALSIVKEIKGPKDLSTAIIYNNASLVYRKKGNYDQAIDFIHQAREIYQINIQNDHPFFATLYSVIGLIYNLKGDNDTSIENYLKALKIEQNIFGEKNLNSAKTYSCIADVFCQKGYYENALKNATEALIIQKDLLENDSFLIADTHLSIGAIYKKLGDYERALEHFYKSLFIKEKKSGSNHLSVAHIYKHIGSTYSHSGDVEGAIKYANKALNIELQILDDSSIDLASTYNLLGFLYNIKRDYETAIVWHKKALKIRSIILGKNSKETANSYNNLAYSYDGIGKIDLAMKFYKKSLSINRLIFGKLNTNIASNYGNLGSLYLKKLDYENALSHYTTALSIEKKISNRIGIILQSSNLGFTYLLIKNNLEACNYYQITIDEIEKEYKLNITGGIYFKSRNVVYYYYAITACFQIVQLEKFFNISERIHAISHLQRLTLKSAIEFVGIDSEKLKTIFQVKVYVEQLTTMRNKLFSINRLESNINQKKDYKTQFLNITAKLNKAESEFNKLNHLLLQNKKYKQLYEPDIASLNEAKLFCINNKYIILEYIIPPKFGDFLNPYVLIITSDECKIIELDKQYSFIDRINELRELIIKGNKKSEGYLNYSFNKIKTLSLDLYRKLLEPALSSVENNYNHILIVPDGPLAFLPFDSLMNSEGKYLSEMFEITLSPSISVSTMIKKRNYSYDKNILAIGGGIYSKDNGGENRSAGMHRNINIPEEEKKRIAERCFTTPSEYYRECGFTYPNIPGSKDEVTAIGKIFRDIDTVIFTGEDATEKKLKELSREEKLIGYSSIHFACHGYYDPEFPFYSALIFSEVSGVINDSDEDGYLSVEDASVLNLQSEIVVLSACNTGMGKFISGDGVTGLTRAFQVAGANSVLVTLWAVDDKATTDFMISMYKKVKNGDSYRKAIADTKKEFKESPEYKEPYYWAGFVLYE